MGRGKKKKKANKQPSPKQEVSHRTESIHNNFIDLAEGIYFFKESIIIQTPASMRGHKWCKSWWQVTIYVIFPFTSLYSGDLPASQKPNSCPHPHLHFCRHSGSCHLFLPCLGALQRDSNLVSTAGLCRRLCMAWGCSGCYLCVAMERNRGGFSALRLREHS